MALLGRLFIRIARTITKSPLSQVPSERNQLLRMPRLTKESLGIVLLNVVKLVLSSTRSPFLYDIRFDYIR